MIWILKYFRKSSKSIFDQRSLCTTWCSQRNEQNIDERQGSIYINHLFIRFSYSSLRDLIHKTHSLLFFFSFLFLSKKLSYSSLAWIYQKTSSCFCCDAFLNFFKTHLSNTDRMNEIKFERITIEYEISRNSSRVESTFSVNMNQRFINAQRRELMTIMQKIWTQRLTSSSAALSTSFAQATESRPERWVAIDLEFFDSTYDGKILTTVESMQHVDKDTYFRNIHLFLNRVKDVTTTKYYDLIRNNLYIYLREIVMTWYTTEIFEKVKKLIKTNNNLNIWERYLIKRFREHLIVTMTRISLIQYVSRWDMLKSHA